MKDSSNPILPIIFIPFNNNENECCYCKKSYSTTLLFKQKYCKYCLILYIVCTASNNLDVHITTIDNHQCSNRHKPRSSNFCIQNIHEWCNSCSEILYFKQIVTNRFEGLESLDYKSISLFENGKDCKFCGKSIYQQECFDELGYIEFKLCSDCYKISSGWVESTLTKRTIPILYLPWWDTYNQCTACGRFLKFKSNCQKLCSNCKIIYTGCRYCLTTNIIFGITDKSQCKKCKRIISITIDITNDIEEESFISTKINTYNYNQISNYTNNKNSNPLEVYNLISRLYLPLKPLIDLILHFQITNLQNIEDYSNPIIPTMFIPFNNDENDCYYCKRSYSTTLLFEQKYCKHCLMSYVKYTNNNNLDVQITTIDSQCSYRHKPRSLDFCIQNIQEWCNSCSEILYFKQIVTNRFEGLESLDYKSISLFENGKDCKFCGKSIYQQECFDELGYIEFKLCSDCYKISSGWVESTLTKRTIPILYLPWWDAYNTCIACDQFLKFKSNCQKLCSNCKMFYIGCKYCLTTNIIFGITGQSQCKKCKRIISIVTDTINSDIEENFITTKTIIYNYNNQIANFMNNVNKSSNPLCVYNFISRHYPLKPLIDLVSYFNITITADNLTIPIPIIFIPFNNDENHCYYCQRPYITTRLFYQKYCKYCLSLYIKYAANENLDVHIITVNSQCNSKHKQGGLNSCSQNIQEWCSSCSEISLFKQIITKNRFDGMNQYNNYEKQKFINNVNFCKLCRKSIFQQQNLPNNIEFKLCLNCYKISFGLAESTLIRNSIPILYLPWWDTHNQCIVCNQFLEFKSSCQKWCLTCKIIYTGCRYCLTTNIIFGITNQSQCKKCKRIEKISITIDTKYDIDTCRDINDVLCYIQNIVLLDSFNCKITNNMNTINENTNPLDIYDSIRKIFLNSKTNLLSINVIPHSQITNFKYIAKGGFGIIYKATWLGQDVAVKRFLNSQNISKYFLNEIKSLFQCYSLEYIVEVYGISQDVETKDYMLVLKYASGGNLHNHLQKNFSNIAWKKKLHTLWKISEGLNVIHKNHFIHRDFHSGNILLAHQTWLICDLGLSLPANYSLSNNEVYGVIPYIAPEIFKGGAFSKESDIYSIGMIMWELTTGCKPFANIDHDVDLIYKIIDGKQPEITKDTPECFANLMKRCWDSDPSKRPLITEITESFNNWYHKNKYVEIFKQAEQKRLELIQLKQLGPEFSEKPHPGAIYTSRPLSSMISNLSSTRSFSIKQDNILIDDNGEYNTKEQDLDIDISESKKRNITKVLQIETSDQEKRIKIVNRN
ncbi:hypothetical protein RhiirA1_459935 [Rhizophagus irregularis]|uniref:Protein kinase domain-containing protein n=1 Tax=Rhizophagus irregularis TaxID=588596 RepID=A0A2N0RSK4_9GLOM|nr:hypothetical protein RhiirA1_459935 [Rhizophagus irregularis]